MISIEATVAELFALAIQAEKAAEELYRGLAAMFGHHEEIARFWQEYAAEEKGHALQLERLRDTVGAETLSMLADEDVLESARKMARFSVGETLEAVEDLEDAYQVTHEVESSETNAVFEFLITHFASMEKAQKFLRSQLGAHTEKITLEFPVEYGEAVSRRAIRASR